MNRNKSRKRTKAKREELLPRRDQAQAAQQAMQTEHEQIMAALKKVVVLQTEIMNKNRKVKTSLPVYSTLLAGFLFIGIVFIISYQLSRESKQLQTEREDLLIKRNQLLAAEKAMQVESKEIKAAMTEILRMKHEYMMNNVIVKIGNRDQIEDNGGYLKTAMKILDVVSPLIKYII